MYVNINYADTQNNKLSLFSQFSYIMTCILTLQSHQQCHHVMILCVIYDSCDKRLKLVVHIHVTDTMPYKMLSEKTTANVHTVNYQCDDVAVRLHRERDCGLVQKITGKYRVIGIVN